MAENHGVTAVIYAIAETNPIPTVQSVLEQSVPVDDLLVIGNLSTTDQDALSKLASNISTKKIDTDFVRAVNLAGDAIREDASRWMWVLDSNTLASPDALAQLLASASKSPSMAVVAPKIMEHGARGNILSFGVSMNNLGKTVELSEGAVDQGQLDSRAEALAAKIPGTLIEVAHFQGLNGFNEKLGADTGLDFGIRTYLSGYRVGLSPAAKVSKTKTEQTNFATRRAAQLRRRFAYAPPWALPFQYLAVIPLMVIRILELLISKKPALIPGEVTGTFAAMVKPAISYSRSLVLKATRGGTWNNVASLRVAAEHERSIHPDSPERVGFLTGGGIMVMLLAAAFGLVMFAPMIGGSWLDGGAIARMSDAPEVLARLGTPWHQFGIDLSPAEPFHYLLAVLSMFWLPNASIAVLWVMILAIPAAAFVAWFAGRTFTGAQIPLGAFALLWAVAPTFLTALNAGRLGAAVSHILLPLLLAQLYKANRSWTASGLSALLLFFVSAGTPALGAVLLVVWLVVLIVRIKSFGYNFWIPIPTLVAFLPIFFALSASGDLRLLLQDTGRPLTYTPAPAWQIGLGFPEADLGGLSTIAIPGAITVFITIAVALLSIPLLWGVILGMLRGEGVMLFFALSLAFIGFILAVLLPRISFGVFSNEAISIWNGSMVSLYWFGLLVVFLIGVERLAFVPVFSVFSGIVVSGGLLLAPILGTSLIKPDGTQIPAVVAADALSNPETLTLELSTTKEGAVGVGILQGDGARLDEYSVTLQANLELTSVDPQLVADLVSGSEAAAKQLYDQGFRWVLLLTPKEIQTDEQSTRHNATASALDSNPTVARIGNLDLGRLWQLGSDAAPLSTDEVTASGEADYSWAIWLTITLAIAAVIATPVRGRID
ncbi:MAG: glycosyltransferase family 2 protein [Microbacteriaceae bacterium]|nr:glycosyltransferase family 2 protein [Microbacteriaceae bacterium]